MRASEDQIAKLKEQHGDLYPVSVELPSDGEVEFVVRSPTKAEYSVFLKESLDESVRHAALRRLVRPCVLFPQGEDLTGLVERFPALHETLGKSILELAGMVSAQLGKKL